jgi:hypothetical protein
MANTRFSISTDPAIQKAIKAHAETAGPDVSAFEDLTAEEQHLVLRVMRSALGTETTGEPDGRGGSSRSGF